MSSLSPRNIVMHSPRGNCADASPLCRRSAATKHTPTLAALDAVDCVECGHNPEALIQGIALLFSERGMTRVLSGL